MNADTDLGALARSLPVPRQTNDPDITVIRLDLHAHGFIVRCEIGDGRGLMPGGPVALDLRDSAATRYERADFGNDWISYTPAIPAGVAWLDVLTVPATRIQLTE